MAGRTQRELASEIGVLRRLRPNLTKAVSHLILSHDPTQRELTEKEWKEAIQIALNEHGAGKAAFASWIHADTQVRHCHLIFCRILPTSDVVSDSHNYRKNEAAARLIERTFMLDAPTPTPAEDRPGDRHALDNASRRAERRGTPPPSKIDAKAVRAALAAARDHEHFLQLLTEMGIEAEFDKRGVAREIYGWRLRRVGADEWLKASTVAKDLSWPKIAHRFVETDSAEQVTADQVKVEGPTAAPAAVQPTRDKYARAPGALRQILREGNSANQVVPLGARRAAPAVRWADRIPTFDMQKFSGTVNDLSCGPLSKSMLLLGAASIGCGLEIIKALISFLQWLLAKLGFGLRPVSQNTSGAEQYSLGYQPYHLEANAREVNEEKMAEQKAADLILQVAAGLDDPSMLPAGEGREELIAEIELEKQKKIAATEAEANPLDDIFGAADVAAPVMQAPEATQGAAPAAPLPDPIISLKQSGAEYIAAVRSLTAANQKPDRGVDAAREKLASAENEFAAANVAFQPMKGKFRIFASPEKMRFLEAEKRVAAAQKNFEAAQDEQDHAPAPVVPAAVSARFQAARVALLKDGRSVIALAQQEAEDIYEPQVKKFALTRAASVKAALTQVLQVAAPGELHKAIQSVESTRVGVAAKLAEIEQLKLRQTHTARLALAPDAAPTDPDAPRAA